MKIKFKMPKNMAQIDKRGAAIHEAAHCVTGEHFGLRWSVDLRHFGKATGYSRAFGGQARIGPWPGKPTDAFRRSCVGWAGPIAEHLATDDESFDERPPDQWESVDIEEFWNFA